MIFINILCKICSVVEINSKIVIIPPLELVSWSGINALPMKKSTLSWYE